MFVEKLVLQKEFTSRIYIMLIEFTDFSEDASGAAYNVHNVQSSCHGLDSRWCRSH